MKNYLILCITLAAANKPAYSSEQHMQPKKDGLLTQLHSFMIHIEVAIAKTFEEEEKKDNTVARETTTDTNNSQQHYDAQLYVDFTNGYIPIIYQEEVKSPTHNTKTLSIEEIKHYRQQAAECRFQQLARKYGPKLYDKIKDRNFDIIEVEQSNPHLHNQA